MLKSILHIVILLALITLIACSSSKELQVTTVNIVIYTDFQCGACEKLHSEVLPELRRLYVSTGKVNIEIRLLGIIDEFSFRAAEAALCAADFGKALEYEDALFKAWRGNDYNAYTMDELMRLAESVDIDTEAFKYCIDSGSKKAKLDENMSMAKSDAVSTLPAFIIDGTLVEGYQPLNTYVKLIEQVLKNH